VDEPTQRLPPEARSYWHTLGAAQGLGAVAAGFLARSMLGDAGVEGVLLYVPLLLGLLVAVLIAAVIPQLRWRRWRYEIRDEEIDLMHGAFVVRRTLIPIRRVQHVDTESGPLQGSFGLTTVTFHTAAGGVAIPALFRGEAERVRARVAELARTRDDT
jgi:membrane protein YdbS with pleckstrin-like domain